MKLNKIFWFSQFGLLLLSCLAGWMIAADENAKAEQKRLQDFVAESKLEEAYTMGYWKGVQKVIKEYPPTQKIDFSVLLREQQSYKEVSKELEH